MSRYGSPLRELLGLASWPGMPFPAGARLPRSAAWPALDVSGTDDAFLVRADVPELHQADIRVTVHDGAVEIAGEVPQLAPGERVVRRAERPRGPFRRVIPLPREADPATVSAALVDGVLTVRIARRVPVTGLRINIS